MYLIFKDDYIRHIDDKLTLYAMLRQLEAVIEKLPECAATADVRARMAAYSPRIKEMWSGWNIPARYLVSGDEADLSDLMEDELMEPEDAGYFCAESYSFPNEDESSDYSSDLADLAESYLTETAKKAVRFARTAAEQANELLNDYEDLRLIFYGNEAKDAQ